MAIAIGPKVNREQLILAVDAADLESYPGAGTVWSDLSLNSNHFTLVNGPTFTSLGGGGIQFDGINDRASLALPSFSIFPQMTFNIWVNQTVTGIGVNPRVFHKYVDSGNLYQLIASGPSSPNNFSFQMVENGITYDRALNLNVTTGQFYNVTIVCNSGLQYYINGNSCPLGGAAGWGPGSGALSLTLGSLTDGESRFNGSINIFHIYNKALTASEVKDLYNTFKPRFKLN